MNIVIGIDEADCRGWLLTLVEDLRAAGHAACFDVRSGASARKDLSSVALALEARLYSGRVQHSGGVQAWQPITPGLLPQGAGDAASPCRLALSGEDAAADLILMLDGEAGIGRLAAHLFSHHIPPVEFRRRDGAVAAAGVPGVEVQDVVSLGIGEFTRRLSTLLLMALDGRPRPLPRAPDSAPRTIGNPLAFVAGSLAGKIAGKLFPARFRADHWRIGLRAARPFRPEENQTIDGFRWLEDDGARYYADPILWNEAGRDYLFVEEFPYATGRGILAFTELDETGHPRFVPRPVIERRTHLSYPYLFRHEGAIYMAPENAAEGHLPLYRARRFPDIWEEMPPLVAGHGLHDATLFEHQGHWWLLANEACHGGGSWDCLVIFHAPSPLGPFAPHALNPVLVDARDARSGGPPLASGGRLYRPVQNCLEGYGRLLQFHEIEELTPTHFRQRLAGRLAPRAGGAIAGAHTYVRSERFEAIDALFPRGDTGGGITG